MELTRSFETLSRGELPLAGGKGANLGAMVQAGLPVPPGFVVLTHAYRLFVERAGIQAEIQRLAGAADVESQESLDAASARIRSLFDQNPVPRDVAEAIEEAHTKLGGGTVAVRSSATAEDLPDASFAGQQETYLNISGVEQVVQAVRRCWGRSPGVVCLRWRTCPSGCCSPSRGGCSGPWSIPTVRDATPGAGSRRTSTPWRKRATGSRRCRRGFGSSTGPSVPCSAG